MTTLKTIDDVIAGLKQAVAERGESYVYVRPGSDADCMYVHDRGTDEEVSGCGVGFAHFLLFGEQVPAFCERMDPKGNGPLSVPQAQVEQATQWWASYYEPEAVEVLRWFQVKQDAGWSWGSALTNTLDGVADLRAAQAGAL